MTELKAPRTYWRIDLTADKLIQTTQLLGINSDDTVHTNIAKRHMTVRHFRESHYDTEEEALYVALQSVCKHCVVYVDPDMIDVYETFNLINDLHPDLWTEFPDAQQTFSAILMHQYDLL